MASTAKTKTFFEVLETGLDTLAKFPAAGITFAFFSGLSYVTGKILTLPGLRDNVAISDIVSGAILWGAPMGALSILTLLSFAYVQTIGGNDGRWKRYFDHAIWLALLAVFIGLTHVFLFGINYYNTLALLGLAMVFPIVFVLRLRLSVEAINKKDVFVIVSAIYFVIGTVGSAAFSRLPALMNYEDLAAGSYRICLGEKCQRGIILASFSRLTAIRYEATYVRTDDITLIERPVRRVVSGLLSPKIVKQGCCR